MSLSATSAARSADRPGSYALSEVLRISAAIADALAALHKQTALFGALCPEAVILDGESCRFRQGITLPLAYSSPEQTGRVSRRPDARTDLYSLGVMMYELLSGSLPFTGTDDMELVHAHIAQRPSPLPPAVPAVLAAIVEKLLEKSPDARYHTAVGLSEDLKRCLAALHDTGTIAPFTVGTTDVPDRIIIPQKLYGRDEQRRLLTDTYKTLGAGRTQAVFLSGYSGIGKSALIRELHRTTAADGGTFVSGKYDQYRRDIPYNAFLQALRQWISICLSSGKTRRAEWRSALEAALGEGASVLTALMPELEYLLGPQPSAPALSLAESQNRFKLLVLRLVAVAANGPQPLVLFLDDLQWADLPSLKLLQFILMDTAPKKFCFIGAYRSNEVDGLHPLSALLADVARSLPLHRIGLSELSEDCIAALVADILHCPVDDSRELAALVYSKTAGNPFFTGEFMLSLAAEKLLQFDYGNSRWTWNTAAIRSRNITDNVVELMAARLSKLPPVTVSVARYAACLGNTFSLEMLAAAEGKPAAAVEELLLPLLKEGLILHAQQTGGGATEKAYSFLHDKVQQAALATISDVASLQQLHLTAARAMQRHYGAGIPHEVLFDIVNQYSLAAALLTDAAERKAVAALAAAAGTQAKVSAAFEPAYRYFRMAMALLPGDVWSTDYATALSLYNDAAEMAYLSADVETMEELTAEVTVRSKTVLDRVQAYAVRINAYTSLARNAEALHQCLHILRELGVTFPNKPSKLKVIAGLLRTKMRLYGKSVASFEKLPVMKGAHELAVMDILSATASSAYFTAPNLFPLVVFRQMALTLQHGISRHSAFAFATYAIIMCGSTQEFAEGQKYADVAGRLLQPQDRATETKLLFIEENFVRHWQHPYADMEAGSLRGYQTGLSSGDFLFGGYAIFNHGNAKFYAGKELPGIVAEMGKYLPVLRSLRQSIALGWLGVFVQTAANLSDTTGIHTKLSGEHHDEATMIPEQEHGKDHSGLCVAWLCKAILSYLLTEDPEEARRCILRSEAYLEHILATPHVVHVHYYAALIHLRLAARSTGTEQRKALRKASGIHRKLAKWAKSAPSNLEMKVALLAAETASIAGSSNAPALYRHAASRAKAAGILQDEALAHELLARHYMRHNDEQITAASFAEAIAVYGKWGAAAKVAQLKGLYPQITSSVNNTGAGWEEAALPLDLQSILKASQTISSEVQLSGLLRKLLHLVIENAGATSGAILLKSAGSAEWGVAATAGREMGGEQVYTGEYLPPERCPEIIPSVVNYVLTTHETVVLHDARSNDAFLRDAMAPGGGARSLLCLPVLQGGELSMIIYLHNTLVEGAFTKDRLQALNLLSGQIAISIQNSILYDTLEQKVADRTAQLQAESEKSEALLRNILPAEIAEELKETGLTVARHYNNVTVLFTDFVDFTGIAEKLTPAELVEELHTCFSAFDEITARNGLEKIKTIGDAYMAVCGLPAADGAHAGKALQAAFEIQKFIAARSSTDEKGQTFQIRIGLNSGPVVAGVVGMKKFAYDIWGDTVNMAARMEQHGEPGQINISQSTYELVKDHCTCTPRGRIPAKNKGEVEMYFVNALSGAASCIPSK